MSLKLWFLVVAVVLCPNFAQAQQAPLNFPYDEDFDSFLGEKLSTDPEDGELDAHNWTISPPNALGGMLDRERLRSLPDASTDKGAVYAYRSNDNTAVALRGGKSGVSITLQLDVPSSYGREIAVKFTAFLLEQQGAQAAQGRIEFSWSKDGLKFTPVSAGSATLKAERNKLSPRVEIVLPTPSGQGRSMVPTAKPNDTIRLYLRWTTPAQTSILGLDDISVKHTWISDALVVWVSVDGPDADRSVLRELVRQRLSARGFRAIACNSDIEEEIVFKDLLAKNGTTRRDDNPSRADLVTLMSEANCHHPPHSQLFRAHLAVQVDSRSTRTAVLRLDPLDKKGMSYSASIAEPNGVHWSWVTLIDNLTRNALWQILPRTEEPATYVVQPWVAIMLPEALPDYTARTLSVVSCRSASACDKYIRTRKESGTCFDQAYRYGDVPDCPDPPAATVAWAARQRRADSTWSTPIVTQTSTSVSLAGEDRLEFYEPGDYLLTTSYGFEQDSFSAFTFARFRVPTSSNQLRMSAAIETGSGHFVGDLSFYRLVARDFGNDFGLGAEVMANPAGKRLLVGPSMLIRRVLSPLSRRLAIDATASPAFSLGLTSHAQVYAAFMASFGASYLLMYLDQDGRQMDVPRTVLPLWFGARMAVAKTLDGSRHWEFMPSVQATTAW